MLALLLGVVAGVEQGHGLLGKARDTTFDLRGAHLRSDDAFETTTPPPTPAPTDATAEIFADEKSLFLKTKNMIQHQIDVLESYGCESDVGPIKDAYAATVDALTTEDPTQRIAEEHLAQMTALESLHIKTHECRSRPVGSLIEGSSVKVMFEGNKPCFDDALNNESIPVRRMVDDLRHKTKSMSRDINILKGKALEDESSSSDMTTALQKAKTLVYIQNETATDGFASIDSFINGSSSALFRQMPEFTEALETFQNCVKSLREKSINYLDHLHGVVEKMEDNYENDGKFSTSVGALKEEAEENFYSFKGVRDAHECGSAVSGELKEAARKLKMIVNGITGSYEQMLGMPVPDSDELLSAMESISVATTPAP